MKHIPQSYVISDTHFGHDKILTFMRSSGTKVRPEFNDIATMNEAIVERWNDTVRDNDVIYHLGDITMKRDLSILSQLRGRKRLIMGNHDICDVAEYAQFFESIHAMLKIPKVGFMLSHVPIHIDCVKPRYINVHGHIHERLVSEDTRILDIDFSQQHPKYYNACVEHHAYTPVPFEKILAYKDAGCI